MKIRSTKKIADEISTVVGHLKKLEDYEKALFNSTNKTLSEFNILVSRLVEIMDQRDSELKNYASIKQHINLIHLTYHLVQIDDTQNNTFLLKCLQSIDFHFERVLSLIPNLTENEEKQSDGQALLSWNKCLDEAKKRHTNGLQDSIKKFSQAKEVRKGIVDKKNRLETELSETEFFTNELASQIAVKFLQHQENVELAKTNNDSNAAESKPEPAP